MENRNFWVFLIIAFVLGMLLGFVYTNSSITGKAAIQNSPTILPVTCTDSDGGWNLIVKGTCIDANSTRNNTDYCFTQGNTTFLSEYYCMSGVCQSTPYNCAALGSGSKCFNGACTGNVTNAALTTGVGQTVGTCGGGVIPETMDISQVPPGAPVKTTGEWTIENYGNLNEESKYESAAVKINDPSLTLSTLCGDLIFRGIKKAAEYTQATGKPCWPACYGSNKEILCNEQCSPTSITGKRVVRMGCMIYFPPRSPGVCIPNDQDHQCDTCTGYELIGS